MKILMSLMPLVCILTNIPASQAQQMNHPEASGKFGEVFCLPYERPMMALKGEMISIECDTAFIINKMRYELYERARQTLIEMDTLPGDDLLKTLLDERLLDLESYNRLSGNFHELERICQDQLKESEAHLQRIKADLDLARSSAGEVQTELAIIKETMRRHRKKSRINKVFWGAGGLAAGIITGALITR